MNEELDSQLSAMFDDELAPAECELMARRLSRDEGLKSRWGRYAIVGAVIRSERGVRLNAPLAGRVNALISAEPALGAPASGARAPRRAPRWWQPIAGGALVAGVAAASLLWLRAQAPLSSVAFSAPPLANVAGAPPLSPGGPARPAIYVTPPTPQVRPMLVPSAQLANYVVAHSMYSAPLAQHNLLASFFTSEPVPLPEAPEAAKDHANSHAQ
jgi:negative regulator of sigma E activity